MGKWRTASKRDRRRRRITDNSSNSARHPTVSPSTAQLELGPRVFASSSALRLQYARSSGPGGQNVNKVNTKAELWVAVESLTGLRETAKQRLRSLAGKRLTLGDEIHIASDERRSQSANRERVFELLRELIVLAQHEPKVRRRTRPTKGSKQRRLESKKHRSQIKQGRRGSVD